MITFIALTILSIIVIDKAYQLYIDKKEYPWDIFNDKNNLILDEISISPEEEWDLIKQSMALAQKKYNTPKKLHNQAVKYDHISTPLDLNYIYAFTYLYYIDNYDDLKILYFRNGRQAFFLQLIGNALYIINNFTDPPKIKSLDQIIFKVSSSSPPQGPYRRPKVLDLP